MSYLFTVCGRAGSKGFKNKNLKSMLDVPLIYYTFAAIYVFIRKYGKEEDFQVVLNTDSDELIRLAEQQQKLNIMVIRRSEELAGDQVPKVSVIRDCLIKAERASKREFDIVVDLDLTSPLRTVEDVKNAVDKKRARPEVDVVYSVTHSRRNPYFNMVREDDGFFKKAIASNFVTRQQTPVFYDMNASIYAYKPEALKNKEAGGFFNDNADAIIMRDTAVLDIDNEMDFELMSVVADYLIKNYPEYREIFDQASQMDFVEKKSQN